MKIEELKKKKVLILGFGLEGQDTFWFLRKIFPDKTLGVGDKNKNLKNQISNLKNIKKIRWHLGKDYLKMLKNYDIIIKSPGIPFKEINPFLNKDQIVTSQTEIFFSNCPGTIIGITGTKGKSTTASLIYEILKRAGIKAHLLGNIGQPALSSLVRTASKDIFVYELSSHQLFKLKQSPHVAVLLNIYPEHLDYYKDFEEYSQAKANITLHQTEDDFLIFNAQNEIVKNITKKSKAKKIAIKGKYYWLDKKAATEVAKIMEVPPMIISQAVAEFKSLPYRLEFIGTFKGINFYNDALATIPEATIEAIDYLGNKVETILLGGFDRNIDFKNLAKKIIKNKIKTLILFPTTGEKIWEEIIKLKKGRGLPAHFFVNNMERAVGLAYHYTSEGKICLLSTASSSFSIFKDYKEKGDLFKKYVKQLGDDDKNN